MSRTEFAQRARNIDENTPLQTKLGFLVAIVVAAYAVGGWVNSVNDKGSRSEAAIASVGAKVDALSDKVDKLAADLRTAGFSQIAAVGTVR